MAGYLAVIEVFSEPQKTFEYLSNFAHAREWGPSVKNGGTRVTCDADLRFKGKLKMVDPVFKLVFKRLGDKAKAGMVERLSKDDLAV